MGVSPSVMNAKPGVPAVTHLVVSLAHGGLERLVVDWTNARNRRWSGSTWIVCLDAPGDLASQVEGNCVACLQADRSRQPWDRGAVTKLRQWMADACLRSSAYSLQPTACSLPLVLHAHNLAAWQYAVLAARGSGVRTIYTQHGANTHNFRFRDRVRSRALAFLTDAIAAVSDATAASMARRLWIPRSRVSVIVNGIDAKRFQVSGCRVQEDADRLRVRDLLRIPRDAIVIGSVGRLAQVKGYDRLIKAASLSTVHRSLFTGYLLLVGDGPERGALEEQAQSLGIGDRVRFAGFQANPAPYLAALDGFVLPSRSEGLSVSLLEAMAAGVPVFVTDAGASREVVEDGACGTLLPDEESGWMEVIGAGLAPGGRATGLVTRARARVTENYSLDATLGAYEALYAGAGRHKSGRCGGTG